MGGQARPPGDDDELVVNPPTPCQIGKHPPAPKTSGRPARGAHGGGGQIPSEECQRARGGERGAPHLPRRRGGIEAMTWRRGRIGARTTTTRHNGRGAPHLAAEAGSRNGVARTERASFSKLTTTSNGHTPHLAAEVSDSGDDPREDRALRLDLSRERMRADAADQEWTGGVRPPSEP